MERYLSSDGDRVSPLRTSPQDWTFAGAEVGWIALALRQLCDAGDAAEQHREVEKA
jgi:hypothetical protein